MTKEAHKSPAELKKDKNNLIKKVVEKLTEIREVSAGHHGLILPRLCEELGVTLDQDFKDVINDMMINKKLITTRDGVHGRIIYLR